MRLDNPNYWADKDGQNVKDFYYFTGDAQSADKRMACEKAHADAVDDIAKQYTKGLKFKFVSDMMSVVKHSILKDKVEHPLDLTV